METEQQPTVWKQQGKKETKDKFTWHNVPQTSGTNRVFVNSKQFDPSILPKAAEITVP
jgi:hypothetical protein